MISTAHESGPSHDHPKETAMPGASPPALVPPPVRPPGKHQLALMIWIAVFPTLTVLNLTLPPRDHLIHPAVPANHLHAGRNPHPGENERQP